MLLPFHVLAFALLAATAALQLNDPDPVFWAGFYLACSLVPLLAVFRIHSRVLYGLCILYGVAALAVTADGVVEFLRHAGGESLIQGMSPDKPYIEEGREFIGTLIALAIVGVYLAGNLARKRPSH